MKEHFSIQSSDFKKENYEFYVIVGDIGGTNSYFAVFGVKNKKDFTLILKYSIETKEINAIHENLNELLRISKEKYDIEVNRCCIGAAGPVSRKRHYIKLTNVDLEINTDQLMESTLLNKIILVNDFEAIGYGLDFLDLKKDTVVLKHIGKDMTGGWTRENVYSVMGAGTGLGMTVAYYDINNHLHVPLPSEGGHIDFSIHDDFDYEFVKYLQQNILTKKGAFPEFERVLSGQGMETIYDYIILKKVYEHTEITKKISHLSGNEKLRAIESNYEKDKSCKLTMDKFMAYYARCARNLALISESYGGLFITGRIALNNLELFSKNDVFMQEFVMHDKRSDVLRKVPVYIIKNEDVGLYGCCNVVANFYYII